MALVLLGLTPLVVDPWAWDDAYMGPKWAWIAAVAGLGVAGVIAGALRGRPLMIPLRSLALALAVWVAWHGIAILWAASPSLAWERAGRVTGLTLAVWVGWQILKGRRALIMLAWTAVALGVVTALWVLLEDAVQAWAPQWAWIHPNLSDWRGYLSAGLGNTNHLGDLLALTLLVTLVLFGEARRARPRWLLGIAAVVQPAALIACFSVGSNLGLLAGAAVMLTLMLIRDRGRWFLRRRRRWLALAAVWIGLIALFNLDLPINPHRPGILQQGFASGRWTEGGPTRLVIWAESLEMIRQHPLLGVGPGNFTYVYPTMNSSLIWNRPDLMGYQGLYTNAAHHVFLQQWAELGIVGLFLFVALLLVAGYVLLHELREASRPSFLARVTLSGLLTGWVTQGQMNFVLQHPTGALTFFVILMAILIEQCARAGRSGMPPLLWETGPLVLKVQWASMRQPTALGIGWERDGRLTRWLAWGVILLGVAWIPWRLRPLLAQHEYRAAMRALSLHRPDQAEAHFRQALQIDPDAQDVRSRYSDWLINTRQRPDEGLTQLAMVRRRLNSNELLLREASAWQQKGNAMKVQAALEAFRARVAHPERFGVPSEGGS